MALSRLHYALLWLRLLRLRWFGTERLHRLGGPDVARTSGVAFPFVLERLSNTPARLHELKV